MVGAELQRRRSPETRASTAIKGKQQGAPRPCTLETKPLWRMGVDEGSSDRSFRRAGVSVGPEFPSDRSFRRPGVSIGPEFPSDLSFRRTGTWQDQDPSSAEEYQLDSDAVRAVRVMSVSLRSATGGTRMARE